MYRAKNTNMSNFRIAQNNAGFGGFFAFCQQGHNILIIFCYVSNFPLAYMDRIFSSMSWLMLVWFFFST